MNKKSVLPTKTDIDVAKKLLFTRWLSKLNRIIFRLKKNFDKRYYPELVDTLKSLSQLAVNNGK